MHHDLVLWEEFEDDCPECRPALIDTQTGQVLPEDHPTMRAVMRVWKDTSLAGRRAFHAFTCLNVRDPEIMGFIQSFNERIRRAIGH